ncbi:hypothetical protein [Streptomyces sp. NPDC050485]|uniref:hypothetical protein n=1 Tax=Streptomyces sp. NPDC050485 TaxID=3365617 RepID=UPI003787DC7D
MTQNPPGGQDGVSGSSLEEELRRHAVSGEMFDLEPGKVVDRRDMHTWGPERTVSTAVLRDLLVNVQQEPVHAKGVRLRGARIDGSLDLESAILRCPLVLEDCYLGCSEPLNLKFATASQLSLVRCNLAGLTGDMLVVTASFDLSGSWFLTGVVRLCGAHIIGRLACSAADFRATDDRGNALFAELMTVGGDFLLDDITSTGAVNLRGAVIGGQLNCSGAQMGVDINRNTLVAEGVKVGSDVFLHKNFTAAGAVRFTGANIAGQLNCSSAQLTGMDAEHCALVAELVHVRGHLLFNENFKASGAVHLNGAVIDGQLSLSGAQLTGSTTKGNALEADGIKVGGDVFLHGGFKAAGAVRLQDADITGQLVCSRAEITGMDAESYSLVADGITVGGHALFNDGFKALGTVKLAGARINGHILLEPAELNAANALVAPGMHVGHEFRWKPATQVTGLVDLERASVHRLVDCWDGDHPNAHWPPRGKLRLVAFTYETFGGPSAASGKQRLEWIRCNHETASQLKPASFASQPYEQLSRVYRQAGQDNDARNIAIARRQDLRKYGDLTLLRRVFNWLMDKTIKYGYETWRAVAGLAAVYVLVLLGSLVAQHYDTAIVPAKDTARLSPAPTASKCTKDYACFYPAAYAADLLVPVINVRQVENWRPNGATSWGWLYVSGVWIATGLGYMLTTLIVIGYTGLVHRE